MYYHVTPDLYGAVRKKTSHVMLENVFIYIAPQLGLTPISCGIVKSSASYAHIRICQHLKHAEFPPGC